MQMLRRTECSPCMLHPTAATYRAYRNINIPYYFQQLCHCQVGIACFETLMSLQGKDQFQVFCFVPVVEESIIPDFLKTGREHMHQVAPDKFCNSQGNCPARIARPASPCGKDYLFFIIGEDAAVGNGNLMGILPQVFNGIPEAVKCLLDIGAPVFFV